MDQPTDQINRHQIRINISDAHVHEIEEEIHKVVSERNKDKKISSKDCLVRFH